MGTLLGFVVGYVVGARFGSRRFDEVVMAFDAIRQSQEFRGLVGALRDHAVGTLSEVSRRLFTSANSMEDAEGRALRRAER